ncbi:MAG: hypothetical protein RL199_1436 [Pseudomonadota bacterium]|jgi:hypothetical protein
MDLDVTPPELRTLPRRPMLPPSFFVVLALGAAFLAFEPTADLSYAMFGPSAAVDLGEPGTYRFDAAIDGGRVRLSGFLGARAATYDRAGRTFEVRQLLGTGVLVRRAPRSAQLGRDVAEVAVLEGRLLRLDAARSGLVERLLRPVARYTPLVEAFGRTGELPAGREVYLLLDGDVPRSSPAAIALPLVLWALVLLALDQARRAGPRRRAYFEALNAARRASSSPNGFDS